MAFLGCAKELVLMKKVIFLFCLSLSFWACSGVESPSAAVSVAELYGANCALCHGADGKLQLADASDLSASEMTVEQRKEIIRNGKNDMVPFGDLLSDGEIAALANFLDQLRR